MRIFIRLAAVVCCSLLIVWLSAAALADLVADSPVKAPEKGASRPNILWISCEDTSPWLGFCGDKYARTPNLDKLAARGVSYTNAFATAPVCAPSRFAIITGCYATAYGTQRLRSGFAVPEAIRGFPAYLREAGYYCTNNSKTDYNTAAAKRLTAESWDECSGKAHWRGRRPDQPFFAVFNLMETHQSQVFETTSPKLAASERHDPALAPLPPYYPDTPTARRTMARVYDCMTAMDQRAGGILAELERAGLHNDTIVFFWGDHGQGIPRGKRTLWDTGLKIPLVVYFPEKHRHLAPVAAGGTCDRLVSLMDLGPTLLSVAELPIPPHLHGQAFLGKAAAAPRDYIFGARDRVDEVLELCRSARDKRYLYLRNYMPDLSWNQPEFFSDKLELRREIAQLAAAGKLGPAQLTYAGATKPREALYDTEKDPWQVNNVADDPTHRPVLERMRKALRDWQIEARDLGFMHETEAARLSARGRLIVEAARDEAIYPLARVLDTAERVGLRDTKDFIARLADENPTVRYWAVLGLRATGGWGIASGASTPQDSDAMKDALRKALDDPSPPVAVEAAGVLVARWDDSAALDRLAKTLRSGDEHARLHAARTLQLFGEKARPALPAMRAALQRGGSDYVEYSLTPAVERLSEPKSRPPGS